MIDAQFGSVPGYFQDTLELRKRSPCDFAGQFKKPKPNFCHSYIFAILLIII